MIWKKIIPKDANASRGKNIYKEIIMKLTSKKLKQIIKEELNAIMIEETMGAMMPQGMLGVLQRAHDMGLFHEENKQRAEKKLTGLLQDLVSIPAEMSRTIAQILVFERLAKRVIDGEIDSMMIRRETINLERYFNENVVAFVMNNIVPVLQGLKSADKAPAQAPTMAPPPTSGGDDDMVFE